MKYEWKKQDKKIYLPGREPELIKVPDFKYFTIKGEGNPNEEGFAEAVGVLYSLAYAVKMIPKKGIVPEGYFEYSVFPLEGVWHLREEAEQFDKNQLIYTLMIRQPEFVTDELAKKAFELVKRKKPHLLLEKASFEILEEGLSVQMLHSGAYDHEPESFKVMEEYCESQKLRRITKFHKEIYITDARKTKPEALKTVLRYGVEQL